MSALKRNIFSMAALQGANYLLPLATIPYLLRILGPENYGYLAYAQAFVQFFLFFTDYGFNLSATKAIAQAEGDKKEISRIFNTVLVLKAIIMMVGFISMSLILWIIPLRGGQYSVFAASYLLVFGSVLAPVWLYQGLQRMGFITITTIVARCITLAAIFVFVTDRSQVFLAALLLAGSAPIAGVISMSNAIKIANIQWRTPSLKELRGALRDGWHVFAASFGGNIYNSSNIIVLGMIAAPNTVGYFAAADKLIKSIQGLFTPISQAAFPHIANTLKHSRENAFIFVGKLLRVFLCGALVITLVLFLGSDQIALYVFGREFGPTAELIEILSPWPILISLNIVFGALFLIQVGDGKLLSKSTLVPAVLHLVILYPATLMGGAKGAALLMLFTETFVIAIRLMGIWGRHRMEFMFILAGKNK